MRREEGRGKGREGWRRGKGVGSGRKEGGQEGDGGPGETDGTTEARSATCASGGVGASSSGSTRARGLWRPDLEKLAQPLGDLNFQRAFSC